MQNAKPLEFNLSPFDYFMLTILTVIFMYIPFFGWAFILNYGAEKLADTTLVNGKQIAYRATYGESLKFVFVNSLLMVITLGIYVFWFYPKALKYVADHTAYVADAATPPLAPAAPAPPAATI